MDYVAKVIRNLLADTQRLQLTYSIGSVRNRNMHAQLAWG